MRITGITAYTSSALRSKNNVSFGKFADKNADDKMKELLADTPQWNPDDNYNFLRSDPSIIIYTAKDGTIQGRLDKDYIKAHANELKSAKIIYTDIEEFDELKDLHIKKNAENLGTSIHTIKDCLECTPAKSSSYASSRDDSISSEEYEKRRIRDIIANSAQ